MATKQAKMLKAATKAFFKTILFLYLIFPFLYLLFPYLFRHCPNDCDISDTSDSFQSIKTVLK